MHNANIEHWRKYAHLHFLIFIWGFTAVLGKLVHLDALNLTWYRLGTAVLALWVWRRWNPSGRIYGKEDYLRFAANGVIIALHWVAFFAAIKEGNVSSTLVAMSSGAFFTSLLEPLWFRRRVDYREIMLGLGILVGIGYLFGISHIRLTALLLALAAAWLSAVFSVWNGLLIRRYPAADLSFYELLSGWVFLALVLLWNGGWVPPAMVLPSDWLWIAILGIICTAYTFTVSLDLLRYIHPFTLMLSINMEPVYGIILALLVFGDSERMTAGFYTGTIIILGIIALNAWMKMKKGHAPKNN